MLERKRAFEKSNPLKLNMSNFNFGKIKFKATHKHERLL